MVKIDPELTTDMESTQYQQTFQQQNQGKQLTKSDSYGQLN